MDDRTLLEKAAKAAGIELRWHPDGTAFADRLGDGYWGVWNPRRDDGDCFRLETALDFDVKWYSLSVCVIPPEGRAARSEFKDYGGDKCAARRDATLLAAAAMADKGDSNE